MSWGPPISVSEGQTTPGAPVAVCIDFAGELPYEFFCAFLADPNGGVYMTRGNNNGWGLWRRLPSPRTTLLTTPGAPINAVSEPNGFFSVFLSDRNGDVLAFRGRAEDAVWQEQNITKGLLATPGGSVTASREDSGVYSLFRTDQSGGVFSLSGNHAGWGGWQSVSQGRTTPGAQITVSEDPGSLSKANKFFYLFLADPNGGVYAIRGNNKAGWGRWQRVPGDSATLFTTPGAPIAMVAEFQPSSIEPNGFISVFFADKDGAVVMVRGNEQVGWGRQWLTIYGDLTKPGAPIAAGTYNIDDGATGNMRVFFADKDRFVVTLLGNERTAWSQPSLWQTNWQPQTIDPGQFFTTPGGAINAFPTGVQPLVVVANKTGAPRCPTPWEN